jgi:hypothetical protein
VVNDTGDKLSPVLLTPDMIPVPDFHQFYDSGDFVSPISITRRLLIDSNNNIGDNLSLVKTTPAIILLPVSTIPTKKLFVAYTLK